MKRAQSTKKKVRQNNLWDRKTVIVMAVVVLAIAAIGFHEKQDSLAASNLCETNGQHYCLGASSFDSGIIVREKKPGRSLYFAQNGDLYHNHPVGRLEFAGTTNSCVAAQDYIVKVTVRSCDAYGTAWARVDMGGGSYKYIARAVSESYNTTYYLGGSNCSDCAYGVWQAGQPGVYYQFQF